MQTKSVDNNTPLIPVKTDDHFHLIVGGVKSSLLKSDVQQEVDTTSVKINQDRFRFARCWPCFLITWRGFGCTSLGAISYQSIRPTVKQSRRMLHSPEELERSEHLDQLHAESHLLGKHVTWDCNLTYTLSVFSWLSLPCSYFGLRYRLSAMERSMTEP